MMKDRAIGQGGRANAALEKKKEKKNVFFFFLLSPRAFLDFYPLPKPPPTLPLAPHYPKKAKIKIEK